MNPCSNFEVLENESRKVLKQFPIFLSIWLNTPTQFLEIFLPYLIFWRPPTYTTTIPTSTETQLKIPTKKYKNIPCTTLYSMTTFVDSSNSIHSRHYRADFQRWSNISYQAKTSKTKTFYQPKFLNEKKLLTTQLMPKLCPLCNSATCVRGSSTSQIRMEGWCPH